MSTLRKFIREVVRSSSERLALLRIGSTGAVLYNANELIKWSKNPDWSYDNFLTRPIVLGYIKIQPPGEKCSDAYEIQSIGGPGWGHILYPVGHAMSPSGRLIPDRAVLSAPARGAWWKRWNELSPEDLLPMDDPEFHNSDGSSKEQHHHHTDNKWDDCPTYKHQGWDHLNWVYPEPQGARELLSRLEGEHAQLEGELQPEMFTYIRQAGVIGDYWEGAV